MNRLVEMREAGLPVNWRTVFVGWIGPGKHERLLDESDVVAEAGSALDRGENSAEVIALASTDSLGSLEIETFLRELAKREWSTPAHEERKWRWLLLKEAIESLPSEPLYALLALTEFWEKFGYPPDSPHVVQGRGNHRSPNEYYTERHYRETVQRHEDWLKRELDDLRQAT
jgi:hypothetical protein